MSRLRRSPKPLVVLAAMLVAALVLSACAYFKGGSLTITQPTGVGAVQVHFQLCTDPEPTTSNCTPAEDEEELQYLLGVGVPPGAVPPATITAVPIGGGPSIVFTRNEEVTAQLTEASASLEKVANETGEPIPAGFPIKAWPPAGTQGFGYLSTPHLTKVGDTTEWNVDASVELPVPAEGAPYPGPFRTALAYGFRLVDGGHPANRPVKCAHIEEGAMPDESEALCLGTGLEGQGGTTDLKIAAPKTTSAFVGGKGTVKFPLKFASSALPYPAFSLSAGSTLKMAKLKLSGSSYIPAAPDPSTHLSAPGSSTVTVNVPSNAKPGTYEVTLSATATPGGGVASQVAKLKITKPKLKFGKLTLNKAKGFALLKVKVPSAGTLTASGKGLVKAQKKTKKAKQLKIKIGAKGKSKSQLAQLGKLKVKAKIRFKPSSGIAVTKTRTIVLKQN